ncbi:MAG: hypothetical protein RSA65_03370 [Clostridia bacterium]
MKIGFIDYYLDEWHANNFPALIQEVSDGDMSVTLAYALIDSPLEGGRTTAQWCEDMGIRQAKTSEEIVRECDGLVVLSPDNCEMHEQLCKLPLESGKPTYVDKTFAPDGETAQRIFAMAEQAGTPCYSTSALRFAHEYDGIEDVRTISSWGPGHFETYAIHQLEPIVMLMHSRARRVLALKDEGSERLMIQFEDGACATLACYPDGGPFMMNIGCSGENRVLKVESDYFGAFIHQLVRFFRTSSELVAHEETIRIMAVRGAGIQALAAPGTWVTL